MNDYDGEEFPLTDNEEPKGELGGEKRAYITDVVFKPNHKTKSGKVGLQIELHWKIFPDEDAQGWGGSMQKQFLFWVAGAEWAVSQVFKAIHLPYRDHPTETYQNGNPKRVWLPNKENLIGRGAYIVMAKQPDDQYHRVVEVKEMPGMEKLTTDALYDTYGDNEEVGQPTVTTTYAEPPPQEDNDAPPF